MVKPLFDNNEKNTKTVKPVSDKKENNPKPLDFSSTVPPKRATSHTPAPIMPSAGQSIFDSAAKNAPTPEIVRVAIAKFQSINNELYQKNSAYCNTQMQLLLPLKIDTVLNWGSKTMDKMNLVNKEANRVIDTVAQTNCNAITSDLVKKMTPSSFKLFNSLKSKIIDTTASEATLKGFTALFTSLIVKCDSLKTDLEYHYSQVTLKLLNLTALTDALGVIPDNALENAVYKRKILLQQGAVQCQMLLHQLNDTKNLMIDQTHVINQLITITLPAFKSANR